MEINVCEQKRTWLRSVHNKWISTPQTFSSTLFVQKPWIFCHSTTLFLNNTHPTHSYTHTHNKLRNIWWNRWATWKEKRTTHNTHFRYHRRWLLETILYNVIPAVEYNNLIYLIYMYKNNNTWMKLHKHENSYENANTNTHPSVKWRNYLPGAEEVNVNIEVNWCNSIKHVFNQMS